MSDRLSTQYLGLSLDNPLVPSASPMTRDNDMPKRLEDAGASAIVMHSLFEEEIKHQHERMYRFMHEQSIGHAEAETFLPSMNEVKDARDDYLERIQALKNCLSIPVIGSLNGISEDGWVDHAQEIEQAGADALELNVYYIAARANESAEEVESRYLEILRLVKQTLKIPVTLKLSSQLSAPVHFVQKLQKQGADGVALFNRFYQPDIDLAHLRIQPKIEFSTSQEALLRIRWIAIIKSQLDIDVAATGGIHTVQDVIKALLAGADVTHMCSALLMFGPDHLSIVKQKLLAWLDEHEYESVAQLKGSLAQKHSLDPSAYERANYLDVIDSYSSPNGVHR